MAKELMCHCDGCGKLVPNRKVTLVSHRGYCPDCPPDPDAEIARMEREEAERLDGIEHERELQEATDLGLISI